ncbi:MAG: coiled-coil domain-containing protein [Actinomycetes bacterium]
MPSRARRTWVRSVGAVAGLALLYGAAPAWAVTPVAGGRHSAASDASAGTRAKLETAQQELARLQKEAAQTNADYVAATARLSLAYQAAIRGQRSATEAQRQADQASRQLGQFAASAYRAGPMAAAAAVLSSKSPAELFETASMINRVGESRAAALQRLQQARDVAADADKQAQHGGDAAAAAAADARRLTELAHRQLARAVELLMQLRAKARGEARAAEARRLAAAQRALASGPGAAPAAATAPGPAPGLPADAGPDPGDGPPGSDHLRPRAERARRLIVALFGVTDIGGWRPSDSVSDDHPNGRALDVMMSTGAPLPDAAHVELGWRVARWAQANAAALGVTYVIWQARIWSVERSAEGWRDYTANFPYGSTVTPTTLHLDHVHISFG